MFDGEYEESSSLYRVRKLIDRLEEELEECCEITCDRDSCLSLIDELKKELEDE